MPKSTNPNPPIRRSVRLAQQAAAIAAQTDPIERIDEIQAEIEKQKQIKARLRNLRIFLRKERVLHERTQCSCYDQERRARILQHIQEWKE